MLSVSLLVVVARFAFKFIQADDVGESGARRTTEGCCDHCCAQTALAAMGILLSLYYCCSLVTCSLGRGGMVVDGSSMKPQNDDINFLLMNGMNETVERRYQ